MVVRFPAPPKSRPPAPAPEPQRIAYAPRYPMQGLMDAEPSGQNIYLNARREWNERYGDYIARERAWRLIALGAMATALLAVVGLVWVSGQGKLIPYVVQVDKLGTPVATQRADVAPTADARVIKAELASWVVSVRSVLADPVAERAALRKAYALVNRRGAAFASLNDYFKAHDPFARAAEETVAVAVASVLPISPTTWRVEWREERRAPDGSVLSSEQWQATVTVVLNPPTDEATLLLNPLGVYVNGFSWSVRL